MVLELMLVHSSTIGSDYGNEDENYKCCGCGGSYCEFACGSDSRGCCDYSTNKQLIMFKDLA